MMLIFLTLRRADGRGSAIVLLVDAKCSCRSSPSCRCEELGFHSGTLSRTPNSVRATVAGSACVFCMNMQVSFLSPSQFRACAAFYLNCR